MCAQTASMSGTSVNITNTETAMWQKHCQLVQRVYKHKQIGLEMIN
jgi:hypothetical protein